MRGEHRLAPERAGLGREAAPCSAVIEDDGRPEQRRGEVTECDAWP